MILEHPVLVQNMHRKALIHPVTRKKGREKRKGKKK